MQQEETPKKVYNRKDKVSSLCQLCGEEKSQLNYIFSNAGKKKQISLKIQQACGIEITEEKDPSASVCRNCESFVTKIVLFKVKCASITQNKNKNTHQIKRCLKESDINESLVKVQSK